MSAFKVQSALASQLHCRKSSQESTVCETGSELPGEQYQLTIQAGGSLESFAETLQLGPPQHFICPISLDIMTDPVLLVETGQSFDRASLDRWFGTGADTCPLTRVQLKSKEVRPDAALQQSVMEWSATGRRRMTVSMPSIGTGFKQTELETLPQQMYPAPPDIATGPEVDSGIEKLPEMQISLMRRLVTCFAPLTILLEKETEQPKTSRLERIQPQRL